MKLKLAAEAQFQLSIVNRHLFSYHDRAVYTLFICLVTMVSLRSIQGGLASLDTGGSIIFNLTFEVKLGTARINVGRIGCGGMCLETACRRFEAAFVLR